MITGLEEDSDPARSAKEPNERCFTWWEVSSGRYLCAAHGGYCGSRDGYTPNCPACSVEVKPSTITSNPVARQLDYINSMRDRAKIQSGIILATPPILAAIVKFLADGAEQPISLMSKFQQYLLLIGVPLWALSFLLLFAAAQNHAVYNSRRFRAEVPSKLISEWSCTLSHEARRRERLYAASSLLMTIGVALMVIATALTFYNAALGRVPQ